MTMATPDGTIASPLTYAPRPTEWTDLLAHNGPGTRDRRGAAAVTEKLGLFPIALYGIAADGGCTCHKGPRCDSAGKHPVSAAWQKMPLDATELDAMLASNWRLNLGLRMGMQPSGICLVAIDVDGDRSLLEPLEAEHGKLPPTLTARTGSGGWHFIFRVPANRQIKNRVRLAPGVDVRSEGGQIVISPSRHRSGNYYSWVDAREPAELFT